MKQNNSRLNLIVSVILNVTNLLGRVKMRRITGISFLIAIAMVLAWGPTGYAKFPDLSTH